MVDRCSIVTIASTQLEIVLVVRLMLYWPEYLSTSGYRMSIFDICDKYHKTDNGNYNINNYGDKTKIRRFGEKNFALLHITSLLDNV